MRDHARGFADTIFDPVRGSPRAWFEMTPIQAFPPFDHRLDLASLSFMLATGRAEDAQVVHEVFAAEREFLSWRGAVHAWNSEKQASRERLSAVHQPGRMYTDDELRGVFGMALKRSLEQATASLPDRTDKVVDRLRMALGELHNGLSRCLPGHTFQFPNEGDQRE